MCLICYTFSSEGIFNIQTMESWKPKNNANTQNITNNNVKCSNVGRCNGFDKMTKVFDFWVNSTNLKRISNSI